MYMYMLLCCVASLSRGDSEQNWIFTIKNIVAQKLGQRPCINCIHVHVQCAFTWFLDQISSK